jgi:hypothetical protein
MDSSYRSFDDDALTEVASPFASRDERRLHVRAYDYWMSILDGRPCPLIEDLDPASLSDFAQTSVLLDFSRSTDNPAITYLGRTLREECGILYGIRTVADVPNRSLLSRLTEKYPEILTNQRPTSFEAEFVSHKGLPTLYRGILLPLSSGGDRIDFVYGVISWKTDARAAPSEQPEITEQADEPAEQPLATAAAGKLTDYLATARASADLARRSESRAHASLYAAIGMAYDFSLAARQDRDDFAALLESEGLSVQARAPMTPIVKLVFGADYDKKRLTEYAAALAHAHHLGLGWGELASYLESYDGGLKALVASERARRAPAPKLDATDKARAALRAAAPQASLQFDTDGDGEFVLLLARRDTPGQLAVLTCVADEALVEKAMRLSSRIRNPR